MTLKIFLVGAVAAAVAVSSALAAPPADKGKPPATGAGCKPRITVVLEGTVTSTPGASATSLSVNVTHGNRWGRAYVKAAQPLSIAVNTDTKIRRQGKKTVGNLLEKDRVLVQARVCKKDLESNATPALTASKVIAHPAKAQQDAKNGKNGKDDKDD
jgi:hypothetical protein